MSSLFPLEVSKSRQKVMFFIVPIVLFVWRFWVHWFFFDTLDILIFDVFDSGLTEDQNNQVFTLEFLISLINFYLKKIEKNKSYGT